MKTLFNKKTATATVVAAVSLALMSFSSPTYVPSGLGSSKAVQVSASESASSPVIIYPVTRLVTYPVVTYTRFTRYITYTDLQTATCDIIIQPVLEYSYEKKNADAMVAKTIKMKMKSLG